MEQHVSTPTIGLGRWLMARRAAHPQLDRSLAHLRPLHLHPLRRMRKSPCPSAGLPGFPRSRIDRRERRQ